MEDLSSPTKKPYRTYTHLKRHWLTIAFVWGFVLDNITLNRVDQVFDNLVLLAYVLIAMISMVVLYAAVAGRFSERINLIARTYGPLLVQFSFGGLLSGMLIFYGRSGAWGQSWPYLLLILFAIYGNETIKDRASRLLYNLAILFIALFSYVVLVVPVLTGQMGAWVFVGSGMLALVIMYWFVQLLFQVIPNYLAAQMRSVVFTLGSIFVGFNVLYFTNIIPPIPLSMKDVGIYHSVVRFENGEYQLKYEKGAWWQVLKNSDRVFHPVASDNVFCFAKVFAPTKLNTEIFHRWEFYNETTKKWEEHVRLSYEISGGRSSGFRGYTLIKNYRSGKWRCSVETARGQVLGREVFYINTTEAAADLVTRVE